MSNKKFYITTPIYYPSNNLHIGHCYTTVAADAMSRYKKMRGYDVHFLTGSDEHGQKIERAAKEKGVSPLDYVTPIVDNFKVLWKKFDIECDDFIRTTDKRHIDAVQNIFLKLQEHDDIYKSEYEGWYCVPCETYFTERQLDEGNVCPDCGRPCELVKEESYFLKMGKYADRLLKHIEANPDFISPASRRNEVTSFINQGLEDLCISRTTFSWGVPVPNEDKHIVYVWLDALSNYISALGYSGADDADFKKYWPCDVHLVGKDIIRFHCIIWPIMLMALDLPLPKKVFAHGWILIGDNKMSKSKGNVIDPMILADKYSADSLRYFLLREFIFGNDGNYSEDVLISRINVDLANDFGNLLSRTTAMISKFLDGEIKAPVAKTEFDDELLSLFDSVPNEMAEYMEKLEFHNALASCWKIISKANKYIDETAPWALNKTDEGKEKLSTVLYNLCEAIRISTILLTPFMPNMPAKVWSQLGLSDNTDIHIWDSLSYGKIPVGTKINRGEPIFPRIEIEKEEKVEDKPKKEKKAKKEEVLADGLITIDQFAETELRVAHILTAEKVEKADKLLKLSVRVGEEVRTVVAGIAKYYDPDQIVGKNVILVANLKPVKLRGIESHGMLLCASDEDNLELITIDNIKDGGRIK